MVPNGSIPLLVQYLAGPDAERLGGLDCIIFDLHITLYTIKIPNKIAYHIEGVGEILRLSHWLLGRGYFIPFDVTR